MPLPVPLNWLAIPGPQKPLYYWSWRDTYGTSWTEEGAFEGWKKSIEDTMDKEGHITKVHADLLVSQGRYDPNVRRWLNFMIDRRHMPHDGPFVIENGVSGAGVIEFSNVYLPTVDGLDENNLDQIARYKYDVVMDRGHYFSTMWGDRQQWQDNWELIEWVVVEAGRDVYWGYIIKIN